MPNLIAPADRTLDSVFHALSDPTRRAVLQRLAAGPAAVTTLAEPFGMALPSFLQHIKVLESGGLIRTVKQGRVRTCELAPDTLQRAEGWLAEQQAIWNDRFDRMEDYLDRLQGYKEGGHGGHA